LEFAGAQFALSKPDPKTGKTRLRLLTEIRQQTGVVAPELQNMPELPRGTEHIWSWYCELDSKRQAGMNVNALSWSDIRAYFDLKRIHPSTWELQALVRLDDAFLASRFDDRVGTVKSADMMKQQMSGKAARRG
jgi:hypothetical protein